MHVLALGKAAPAMAAGALDALRRAGATCAGGLVVCAQSPDTIRWPDGAQPLEVVQGDHPVPGPASLDAADRLDEAIQAVDDGDLVCVLVSGGTTALCAAAVPALAQLAGFAERAQAHIANVAQTLLESGLAIHEMNAIRRRLLRFGAGRLAIALARRGAHRIGTFAISDVIGDDPSVIGSGPCSPDPLDAAGFLALVDAHDMRTRLERAVTIVLGLEGAVESVAVPSPQDPAFSRVDYELVAGNRDALEAMETAAHHAGIAHVACAPIPLEGAADTLGELLVQQALDVAAQQAPNTPVLLLHGGEPVVHLRETVERAMAVGDADEPLRGGRMQVVALSAALALEAAAMRGETSAWRVSVLAAGTDGRDGPTDAAGAIVDAAVPALARRHGRTPESDLATGRSWFSLDAAEALLRTGPTGTNVMDVVALLVR